MIMLSSEIENHYGKFIKGPKNLNGINTQAPYVLVENIEEHYKKSIAGGAKILIEIKDEAYGSRGYTCKDLEDFVWNFGSYDPRAEIES